MTINQLKESPLAKVCCLSGMCGDATPFLKDGNNIETFCEMLKNSGYEKYGKERMYCGMTGKLLPTSIYIGPVYYQRLKHMVSDKIHARACGNVQTLSQQPLSGRSRYGGLKFGTMERDSIIAHGAAAFLKDRLFGVSDPYSIYICENCNFPPNTSDYCSVCNSDKIVNVNLPYACKLLFQDLNACCIKTEIKPTS